MPPKKGQSAAGGAKGGAKGGAAGKDQAGEGKLKAASQVKVRYYWV